MARGGYKRDALAALVAQRRSKEQEVTRQLQRGISKHTSTTPNPHRKRSRSGGSSAKKRFVVEHLPKEAKKEQPGISVEQNAEEQRLAKAERKRLRNQEKKRRKKIRKQLEDEARAQPLPGHTKTTPQTQKRPLPLHYTGAAQIFSLNRRKKHTAAAATTTTTTASVTSTTTTTQSQPSPLDQRGTSLLSDPFIDHDDSSPGPEQSFIPPISSPHPSGSSHHLPGSSPLPPPTPDILHITPSRPRPPPPLEHTLTPHSHPSLLTTASLLHILTTRTAHLNAQIPAFTTLLAKARAALHTTSTSTTASPINPSKEESKDPKDLKKRIAALEKIIATSERHCNEVLVMELALRDVVAEGTGEGLEGVVGRMGEELRGMVGGYEGRMRVLLGRVSREVVGRVEGEREGREGGGERDGDGGEEEEGERDGEMI